MDEKIKKLKKNSSRAKDCEIVADNEAEEETERKTPSAQCLNDGWSIIQMP